VKNVRFFFFADQLSKKIGTEVSNSEKRTVRKRGRTPTNGCAGRETRKQGNEGQIDASKYPRVRQKGWKSHRQVLLGTLKRV